MKQNIKKIYIITMLILILMFTACSKETEFNTGSFDGMTFTNEWANMKFVFPEDSTVASQEEMDEITRKGNSLIYSNDEEKAKAMENIIDLKVVYDFMVSSINQTPIYQLMYENLALTIGGTKYTEKTYLEECFKPIFSNNELGYKLLNEGKKTIAGKEFYYYSLSGYNNSILQDMYCYKLDNRIISFTVTYLPGQENLANEVLNNITEAN